MENSDISGLSRGMVSVLIIYAVIAAVIFLAVLARAENVYPITWDWPANTAAAEIEERYPWVRLAPERVAISLSLDNGATWEALAHGVDSVHGLNTWQFRLPDEPRYLTASGRVRVSSLPGYRTVPTEQIVPMSIAGIHMIAPPVGVTNGANVTLRWVASGAGPLVTLGTRVIGATRWIPQAVFASVDSNQGSHTNSAVWAVSGLQSLPTEIVLQSLADPLCYRRHPLIVEAAP